MPSDYRYIRASKPLANLPGWFTTQYEPVDGKPGLYRLKDDYVVNLGEGVYLPMMGHNDKGGLTKPQRGSLRGQLEQKKENGGWTKVFKKVYRDGSRRQEMINFAAEKMFGGGRTFTVTTKEKEKETWNAQPHKYMINPGTYQEQPAPVMAAPPPPREPREKAAPVMAAPVQAEAPAQEKGIHPMHSANYLLKRMPPEKQREIVPEGTPEGQQYTLIKQWHDNLTEAQRQRLFNTYVLPKSAAAAAPAKREEPKPDLSVKKTDAGVSVKGIPISKGVKTYAGKKNELVAKLAAAAQRQRKPKEEPAVLDDPRTQKDEAKRIEQARLNRKIKTLGTNQTNEKLLPPQTQPQTMSTPAMDARLLGAKRKEMLEKVKNRVFASGSAAQEAVNILRSSMATATQITQAIQLLEAQLGSEAPSEMTPEEEQKQGLEGIEAEGEKEEKEAEAEAKMKVDVRDETEIKNDQQFKDTIKKTDEYQYIFENEAVLENGWLTKSYDKHREVRRRLVAKHYRIDMADDVPTGEFINVF